MFQKNCVDLKISKNFSDKNHCICNTALHFGNLDPLLRAFVFLRSGQHQENNLFSLLFKIANLRDTAYSWSVIYHCQASESYEKYN